MCSLLAHCMIIEGCALSQWAHHNSIVNSHSTIIVVWNKEHHKFGNERRITNKKKKTETHTMWAAIQTKHPESEIMGEWDFPYVIYRLMLCDFRLSCMPYIVYWIDGVQYDILEQTSNYFSFKQSQLHTNTRTVCAATSTNVVLFPLPHLNFLD